VVAREANLLRGKVAYRWRFTQFALTHTLALLSLCALFLGHLSKGDRLTSYPARDEGIFIRRTQVTYQKKANLKEEMSASDLS